MEIKTLEEAQKRIHELEKEIAELKSENENLRNRNFGGRKKHDDAWLSGYNIFIEKYENGSSINDIVAEGSISKRTAYRYLEYYKKIKNQV